MFGHLLALSSALVFCNAAKLEMNFLTVGEAAGEENGGIMAAMLYAANEINASPDPDLFGQCEPEITLHFRDHEANVNIAAAFIIDEVPQNTVPDSCECTEEVTASTVFHGILGPDYSSISTVMSPVASVFELALLSYWATSPKLNEGAYSNFFRTIPDDEAAALGVLEYLSAQGIKYANVMYTNDPYGAGFNEALLGDALPTYGIKMESFPLNGANMEVSGTVINDSQVNVWVIVPTGTEAQDLSPLFSVIERPIHFIFSETMSNSFLHNYDDNAHAKLTGSLVIKAQGYKAGLEKADELKEKLATEGISEADWLAQPAVFHTYGTTDTPGKFPTAHDVTAFSYDAVYAMALAMCNGEDNDPLNGLPDVEFDGASGRVKFVPGSGTRDPTTAYMTASGFNFLENKEGKFSTSKEDAADSGGFFYEFSGQWGALGSIEMEGGAEFTDLVPLVPEITEVDDWVEAIVIALAGIAIFSSLAFMLWTMKNYKTKIVRRAQPGFLYIMCLGCILSSSVPIIMSQRDSSSCKLAWVIYACGFSLSMGAIGAKTLRVYRMIDAAKKLNLLKLTFYDALPPLVFIFTLDITFALLMINSGDVDFHETESEDLYGRVEAIEKRCGVSREDGEGGWFYVFFLCNICILAILTILLYKSRKISTEFSEAKYIFASVLSAFELIFCSFLVIAFADTTPVFEYAVLSLMTLFTDVSTLYFIFLPKVYLLYVNGANNSRDSLSNSAVSHAGSTASSTAGEEN